jgi:hypothetical protein
VPNVVFLSAAGCDLAERDKQPRLREFIHLETLFLSTKGDPSSMTGHCPVVIRCVSPLWLHAACLMRPVVGLASTLRTCLRMPPRLRRMGTSLYQSDASINFPPWH